MKILCPIDFSETSISATDWTVKYLTKLGGGTVEFLHCINLTSRAGMFLKMDDVLTEWAERDMKDLIAKYQTTSDGIKILSKVVVLDPKSFISSYATQNNFDWIVVGTQGLTALKDITVGSVTEYIINKSEVPVIAVPKRTDLEGIEVVVLGLDQVSRNEEQAIRRIVEVCLANQAKLLLVHFRQSERDPQLMAPTFLAEYPDLSWHFEEREATGDLVGLLNTYCRENQADLLCLIHQRRKWWQRVFTKSLSKSELFRLEIPLLVLSKSS